MTVLFLVFFVHLLNHYFFNNLSIYLQGKNILDLVFCISELIDSIDICDTFISDHCLLTVELDRSFIYAAPCEWNKLSECIRTSSFDSFRKSVKTMLFTQQYG